MSSMKTISRRRAIKAAFGLVAVALATLSGRRPALASPTSQARPSRRWECQNDECEPFIYDPAVGIPDLDIPPGIPFEDLPDDFLCPICGDVKAQFVPLAESY